MNIKQKIINSRRGGLKAIIALLMLLLALVAGIVLNGSLSQEKQESLLNTAYASFNQADYEKAFQLFNEARETYTFTLKSYRLVRSGEYVSAEDLGEIIVSTCLAAIYDSLFKLEAAPTWVARAKDQLTAITDPNRKSELEKLVATAGSASELCQLFTDGDIENALRGLKKVEQSSIPGDQDFFIFEIRFLIACGKALEEPLILNQARELLFFATTDAGINNEKTQKLWGILTN